MDYHYQIKKDDIWVECDVDEFNAFEGIKKYGPYGRETIVYDNEHEFNAFNFMGQVLCAYAGRSMH